MNKTPDTRNKLESIKVPKAKKKKIVVTKTTFREIKEIITETSEIKPKIVSNRSKGQLFKEEHGYSKSIARAMRKRGFHIAPSSFEIYKEIRKENKKRIKKSQQDKRALSRANKIANRATRKKK